MSFLLLLNDLFQFRRHWRNVLAQNLHFTAGTAADDDVEFAERFVFVWIILTEVAAAALAPLQGRTRDGFGNRQKIGQVERGMPAAVVFAVPLHSDLAGSLLQFAQFLEAFLHFRLVPYDPDEFLHFRLQFVLDLLDVDARRNTLEALCDRATRAVVLAEGLLIYLTPEDVVALARDIAAAGVQRWIIDLASPALLDLMKREMSELVDRAGAPYRFAPADGPDFFRQCGWIPTDVRSMFRTAAQRGYEPM